MNNATMENATALRDMKEINLGNVSGLKEVRAQIQWQDNLSFSRMRILLKRPFLES